MFNIKDDKNILKYTPLIVYFLCLLLPSQFTRAASKPVIGWIEHVKIMETGLQVKAKIDTGADSSSVNAKLIEEYTRNGKNWLRFQIYNNGGEKIILDKKIVRYMRLKRRKASSIRRPVVTLNLCVGQISREIEINLSDRSNFKYVMLIGRDFLRDTYLVDSSKTLTIEPDCQ